jgi:hypothetical protein
VWKATERDEQVEESRGGARRDNYTILRTRVPMFSLSLRLPITGSEPI